MSDPLSAEQPADSGSSSSHAAPSPEAIDTYVGAISAVLSSPTAHEHLRELINFWSQSKARSAEVDRLRAEHWATWVWRYTRVHAFLCLVTLAVVTTLSLTDKLPSEAVVPLLAGVVASLFVRPSRSE